MRFGKSGANKIEASSSRSVSPGSRAKSFNSSFQPIARPEHPPHDGETQQQEQQRHRQAEAHADVGALEKAPAEPADQINDRIEQGDVLPERRQYVDGVEAAPQE